MIYEEKLGFFTIALVTTGITYASQGINALIQKKKIREAQVAVEQDNNKKAEIQREIQEIDMQIRALQKEYDRQVALTPKSQQSKMIALSAIAAGAVLIAITMGG